MAIEMKNSNELIVRQDLFPESRSKRFLTFVRSGDPVQRKAAANIGKFFALLFALTLIANGTSAATLAQVSVKTAFGGVIEDTVKGNAEITSVSTLGIAAPEGLIINKILINEGQLIKPGDAIAEFDRNDVESKLIRESAVLDSLLFDLDRLGDTDEVDKTSVESATLGLARAREDHERTQKRVSVDIAMAQASLNTAQNKGAEKPDNESLTSAQRNLTRAEDDLEAARREYNNDDEGILPRDFLLSYERRIEDAKASLRSAEASYTRMEAQNRDSWQASVDNAKTALENAQTRASDDLLHSQRRIQDAEQTLNNANENYNQNVERAQNTAKQNSINAISLQLDISNQRVTVETLEALIKNDCILYSEIEGIVFDVAADRSVINGKPIVSVKDSSRGFEAQMKLKRTPASKLQLGNEATVTTSGGSIYYTPTVKGIVSAISLPDDDDMVTVTVALPDGDWRSGEHADVQITLSSQYYDQCIPSAALSSDATGYFLFIIEEQNTVLGVQNRILRVNVEVLTNDGEMASVLGPIDRSTQVIVSSNKAITTGDRVKVDKV
jgi:multidrug efflux pump subunit AcrA (membrane-fusion protein)